MVREFSHYVDSNKEKTWYGFDKDFSLPHCLVLIRVEDSTEAWAFDEPSQVVFNEFSDYMNWMGEGFKVIGTYQPIQNGEPFYPVHEPVRVEPDQPIDFGLCVVTAKCFDGKTFVGELSASSDEQFILKPLNVGKNFKFNENEISFYSIDKTHFGQAFSYEKQDGFHFLKSCPAPATEQEKLVDGIMMKHFTDEFAQKMEQKFPAGSVVEINDGTYEIIFYKHFANSPTKVVIRHETLLRDAEVSVVDIEKVKAIGAKS